MNNRFAQQEKSSAAYLDRATNEHGREKGDLVRQALDRLRSGDRHVVEIGPGGGAAVQYLANNLTGSPDPVQLTLIEAPGVVSASLKAAMGEFEANVGPARLIHGWANEILSLVPEQVSVVANSALLHEVYSYGGGYRGLHTLMRELTKVIEPYGYCVYRDVYAVEAATLHERVTQTYQRRTWVQFLRMFTPYYLRNGTHPYHRHDDEAVARQNSVIVPLSDLRDQTSVTVEAPVGIFREVQRHYITMRDHVWRSGVLGFIPFLTGQLADDWSDFGTGHKRVHFQFADSTWVSAASRENLRSLSEPYGDHYVVDGDIFDTMTDVELVAFLDAADNDDDTCAPIWQSWLEREGRETYAYLTIGDLLTAFAVNSLDAGTGHVLMPRLSADVSFTERQYYHRYLRHHVPNPLPDAKQLVMLQSIPVGDRDAVQEGLQVLREHCSKTNLARVYAAIG